MNMLKKSKDSMLNQTLKKLHLLLELTFFKD